MPGDDREAGWRQYTRDMRWTILAGAVIALFVAGVPTRAWPMVLVVIAVVFELARLGFSDRRHQ